MDKATLKQIPFLPGRVKWKLNKCNYKNVFILQFFHLFCWFVSKTYEYQERLDRLIKELFLSLVVLANYK